VRVFLDTSVLLAASVSRDGSARRLFRHARREGWELVTAHWCVEEAVRNLRAKYPVSLPAWRTLRRQLRVVPSTLVLDRPLVFAANKDRPVLVSALASGADALATYDRADFQDRLGRAVYGMRIALPRDLL
jgi:predicted nucleic acid-binding protein